MYRRHISQLKPGQVLGKSIYTERGDVLLGAGTILNQFYIDRLGHRGVISVFLRDGLGDDVEPNDIVSEELRAATVTHLARAFDVIGAMAHGAKLNNGERPRTVHELVHQLGERPLDMPTPGINSLQALYQDIESLMNEILESNTIASLESLKTSNALTGGLVREREIGSAHPAGLLAIGLHPRPVLPREFQDGDHRPFEQAGWEARAVARGGVEDHAEAVGVRDPRPCSDSQSS